MSELEKMGRNLMDIALQYTHPNFEGMYSDWGAVCNIGEELVKMSKERTLNENQQIVLDWLKNRYTGNADPFGVVACLFSQTPRFEVIVTTLKLTRDEQAQVLKIFANWDLEQEAK